MGWLIIGVALGITILCLARIYHHRQAMAQRLVAFEQLLSAVEQQIRAETFPGAIRQATIGEGRITTAHIGTLESAAGQAPVVWDEELARLLAEERRENHD